LAVPQRLPEPFFCFLAQPILVPKLLLGNLLLGNLLLGNLLLGNLLLGNLLLGNLLLGNLCQRKCVPKQSLGTRGRGELPLPACHHIPLPYVATTPIKCVPAP